MPHTNQYFMSESTANDFDLENTRKELPERFQEIFKDAGDPKTITAKFKCQQCGARCCSKDFIKNDVIFLPNTLAYYRQKRGNVAADLAMADLSPSVGPTSKMPLYYTEADFCPFMLFKFNKEKMNDIRAGLSEALNQVEDGMAKIVISMMPSILDKMVAEDKFEFTPNELRMFNGDGFGMMISMAFMEFLKDYGIKAICDVYEERPGACKTFPFGRLHVTDKKSGVIKELAVLQKDLPCPPEAFETDEEITAHDFFKSQGVTNAEDHEWGNLVLAFADANEDYLANNAVIRGYFYGTLFEMLYKKIKYNPDRKTFIEKLTETVIAVIDLTEEVMHLHNHTLATMDGCGNGFE